MGAIQIIVLLVMYERLHACMGLSQVHSGCTIIYFVGLDIKIAIAALTVLSNLSFSSSFCCLHRWSHMQKTSSGRVLTKPTEIDSILISHFTIRCPTLKAVVFICCTFCSNGIDVVFCQSHAPYEFFDYNKLGPINCTHLLLFSFISTPQKI